MVFMLIFNEGLVFNVVFLVILLCKLIMFIDIWIFQGWSLDIYMYIFFRFVYVNECIGIFDLF